MATSGFSLKHALLVAAKATIAIGLLVWLVATGRLDLTPLMSRSNAAWHAVALVVAGASIVLQALRWRALLRMQSIEISAFDAIQLTAVGYSGSLLLPGAAGGDLVKAYFVARHAPDRKVAGSLSVLVDRALGMYSLFLVGAVAMAAIVLEDAPTAAPAAHLAVPLGAVLVTMTAAIVVSRFRRARALLARLIPQRFRGPVFDSLEAFSPRPRDLVVPFLLSLAATLTLLLTYLVAARVAGEQVPWSTVCAVAPLVVIASVIPLAPNGLGVAETAAALLFSQFGVGVGAAIIVLNRVWTLLVCLPGLVLFVLKSSRKRAAEAES